MQLRDDSQDAVRSPSPPARTLSAIDSVPGDESDSTRRRRLPVFVVCEARFRIVAAFERAPFGLSHNSPTILPAFGDGADFGLFLGFVAEAFGEELVHEGLFQLGGGLNDPLLRFDRPLHRRKDVRDLLLLGEWGEWDNRSPRTVLLKRCRPVLPSVLPAMVGAHFWNAIDRRIGTACLIRLAANALGSRSVVAMRSRISMSTMSLLPDHQTTRDDFLRNEIAVLDVCHSGLPMASVGELGDMNPT